MEKSNLDKGHHHLPQELNTKQYLSCLSNKELFFSLDWYQFFRKMRLSYYSLDEIRGLHPNDANFTNEEGELSFDKICSQAQCVNSSSLCATTFFIDKILPTLTPEQKITLKEKMLLGIAQIKKLYSFIEALDTWTSLMDGDLDFSVRFPEAITPEIVDFVLDALPISATSESVQRVLQGRGINEKDLLEASAFFTSDNIWVLNTMREGIPLKNKTLNKISNGECL